MRKMHAESCSWAERCHRWDCSSCKHKALLAGLQEQGLACMAGGLSHHLLPPASTGLSCPGPRWRTAFAHVALSATLAAHTLLREPCPKKPLDPSLAFKLAWQLVETLGNGGSSQCSVHACAAQLMCASVRSIVVSARCWAC